MFTLCLIMLSLIGMVGSLVYYLLHELSVPQEFTSEYLQEANVLDFSALFSWSIKNFL